MDGGCVRFFFFRRMDGITRGCVDWMRGMIDGENNND